MIFGIAKLRVSLQAMVASRNKPYIKYENILKITVEKF